MLGGVSPDYTDLVKLTPVPFTAVGSAGSSKAAGFSSDYSESPKAAGLSPNYSGSSKAGGLSPDYSLVRKVINRAMEPSVKGAAKSI